MSAMSATSTSARVRGVGAALALAALTVGLPVLLWTVSGSPVPTGVPSGQQVWTALSQPDSTGVLTMGVLKYVAWACWALLLLSLLGDLAGRLRGRALPSLGPQQQLVAKLITAVVVALAASPGAPAQASTPAPATATELGLPAQHSPSQAHLPAAKRGVTRYQVHAGDTLWDIAEEHLGDPWRWPEIFHASTGIRQSDGLHLTDPDVIAPGWTLHVPTAHKPSGPRTPNHRRSAKTTPTPIEPTPEVVTPFGGHRASAHHTSSEDPQVITPLTGGPYARGAGSDEDTIAVATPLSASPADEADDRWRAEATRSTSRHRLDWRATLEQPYGTSG